MTSIDIRHFSIEPDAGAHRPPVVYEVKDWIRQCEDYGAVIVRIGVDGEFDEVQADFRQTNDLAGLDRAIAALTAIREGLAALYVVRPGQTGRCLASADWGRCKGPHGHEGGHEFPVEPMDVETLAAALKVVNA